VKTDLVRDRSQPAQRLAGKVTRNRGGHSGRLHHSLLRASALRASTSHLGGRPRRAGRHPRSGLAGKPGRSSARPGRGFRRRKRTEDAASRRPGMCARFRPAGRGPGQQNPSRAEDARAEQAAQVEAGDKMVNGPVMIFGHSSGGPVALESQLASPSSFAGGVIYEPASVIGPPGPALRVRHHSSGWRCRRGAPTREGGARGWQAGQGARDLHDHRRRLAGLGGSPCRQPCRASTDVSQAHPMPDRRSRSDGTTGCSP
jgi:hypothetical protein